MRHRPFQLTGKIGEFGVFLMKNPIFHRYKRLKGFLRRAFDESGTAPNEMADKQQIERSMQEMAGNQPFTDLELAAAYEKLSDENIIFVDGNQILLI